LCPAEPRLLRPAPSPPPTTAPCVSTRTHPWPPSPRPPHPHPQLQPKATEEELEAVAQEMWRTASAEDRQEYVQEAVEQLYKELQSSAASIAEEAGRSVQHGVLPALLAGASPATSSSA
jgi:hypothetical protein